MSGNGSVNAHNNAFSGGKNPSLSGYSGYTSGGNNTHQSGHGGASGITVCTWVHNDPHCPTTRNSKGEVVINICVGMKKECVNIPFSSDSSDAQRLFSVRAHTITLSNTKGTSNDEINASFHHRPVEREGDKVAAVLRDINAVALTKGIAYEVNKQGTFIVQIPCTDIFRISIHPDGTINNVSLLFEVKGGSNRNPSVPGKIKEARKNEAIQKLTNYLNEQKQENERKTREDADRKHQEVRQREHEAEVRRLEHENFCSQKPLEAAQRWVNDAINHINAMEHNKNHAEHLVRESEQRVQQLTNEFNHLKAKVDGVRHRSRGFGGKKKSFVLDAIGNAMCIADWDRQLDRRRGDIQAAQDELNQRRTHIDHGHHQLHEAHQNKSRADANLGHVQNTIRQQQEAHAAHVAQQEAQRKADEAAALQRKANEAAEVQRKAEAAELKEQQEAQRKADDAARVANELIAARSLNPENIRPPASLPSQNQAAAMAATAGLANTAPAAEGLLARVTAAMAELGRIASLSKAGPHAAIITAGLYPKEAGLGSDQVHGGKLFVKALPAAMLNMPSEERLRLAALEQNAIDVHIRGRLVLTNGQIAVELIRTKHPTPVRVVAGVPDGKGNYQCTLPGTDELPARTILVTPANAPGSEGLGAIITPDNNPKPVTHTGNNAQPVTLPTVTTLPGFDSDLIVVPPLETGDKPIYVMLSGRKESYRPNQGAVGNMGEFFKQTGFGEHAKNNSQKTNKIYQGQTVYRANDDISQYLEKGDQFYLDGMHRDHLEVFDMKDKFKHVLNLDGSINSDKTIKANGEGRTLK